MTNEDAIRIFNTVLFFSECDCPKEEIKECLNMAIKALKQESCEDADNLQIEPLTDIEQRIFLAAMSREEKVCKEVCTSVKGDDMVVVCYRILRKVKNALWG